MAVAVVFGLAFATLLTLIVVPTLYAFFDDTGVRFGSLASWVRRLLPGRRARGSGGAPAPLPGGVR
jgi:hypothetical protein